MKKVLQWLGLALVLAGLLYLVFLEKSGMDFQTLTKPAIFALLLASGAGAMLFGESFDKVTRLEKRVRDLEDEVRRLGGGRADEAGGDFSYSFTDSVAQKCRNICNSVHF